MQGQLRRVRHPVAEGAAERPRFGAGPVAPQPHGDGVAVVDRQHRQAPEVAVGTLDSVHGQALLVDALGPDDPSVGDRERVVAHLAVPERDALVQLQVEPVGEVGEPVGVLLDEELRRLERCGERIPDGSVHGKPNAESRAVQGA